MPSKNDPATERTVDRFLIRIMNQPDSFFWVCMILALAVIIGFMTATFVSAHPGGVSPKDGCHKQDGKRHWHKKGSKIGGRCYTKGGHRYREKVIKQVIIKKPEPPKCEALKNDFLANSSGFVLKPAVDIARMAIDRGCWK